MAQDFIITGLFDFGEYRWKENGWTEVGTIQFKREKGEEIKKKKR
jgi:hypothetical protein